MTNETYTLSRYNQTMPLIKPDVTDVRHILRKYGGEIYSYDFTLCTIISRLFSIDLDTFPDESSKTLKGEIRSTQEEDKSDVPFYTYTITIMDGDLPIVCFDYPSLNFTKFKEKLITEFSEATQEDKGYSIREHLIKALKVCSTVKMIYLAFSLSNMTLEDKPKYSIDIIKN